MNDDFLHRRRAFLLKAGAGLGALSLAELLGHRSVMAQTRAAADVVRSGESGALGAPHFRPRAKRVICLHMLGGISQADTFDYKPTLVKLHGQELPASVRGTQRLSFMTRGQSSFPIMRPLASFTQYGQAGTWVSGLMPYTARIVDDLCFIKTMNTEHVNHDPASKFLHTGYQLTGRPSAGAWVSYALGSDNQNLPSYIVLTSGGIGGVPLDSNAWGSGFLPSHYQGVKFQSGNDAVLYVGNPKGLTLQSRRRMLDAIGELAGTQQRISGDPEIPSKISQYEMAYRMQSSAPEVADISKEPQHILDLYGPDVHVPGSFARNCLLARRLAERDVKFITLFHMGWDHHNNIAERHPPQCRSADQASAALVIDLKQRGMLEDTLVVWGSEFGRTSFTQGYAINPNAGRDHHGRNFVWWLAGAGVKAGYTHGETDDFSYNIVKDPVHIHDFNATLLHALGIDHERLTFKSQGRDFRLTDVHGKVVNAVLA